MTVSVLRPRKSNFTRPAASTSSFANWDTSISDLSSLYAGTYSHSGLSAMTTPAAGARLAVQALEAHRDVEQVLRRDRLLDALLVHPLRSRRAFVELLEPRLRRDLLAAEDELLERRRLALHGSGTSFAILSPSANGSPITRTTSRMTERA